MIDRTTIVGIVRLLIAWATVGAFLLFDEAAWVSGSVLLVSGGAVMTSDPYRYLLRVNKDAT